MLATLNSKQIVDEIVKDTGNDPHDVLEISPDVVHASRAGRDAPPLAPEIASRPAPGIGTEPGATAAAPSVDTAVRAAASDVARKRSPIGRWLGGAFTTLLLAAGSAGATIAWQVHGDTAREMIAAWIPAFTAAPSQATPASTDQPAAPVPQAAAADQPAEQPPTPAQGQDRVAAPAPDVTQSLQSVTRDLAAMTQQIGELKANIAELKSAQEQMAREMATRTSPPRPDARAVDPRARMSALPPRAPAPPVRKPKPVAPQTPVSPQAYAPPPVAPLPQSQATAVPPPPAAAATPQVADDDGPVVRPPMPVH
jgi:hypothetical protein